MGRFAWAIRAPGHDPAEGFLELRPDEVADLGEVLLRRGSGVIEGRVTDLGGLPVSGADVSVTDWLAPVSPDSGDPARSTKTHPEGRFRFEGVPAGCGFVQVDAPGLAAIPARLLEMRAWKSRWLEMAPAVGTLGLSVRGGRGAWSRGFCLVLEDRIQRLKVDHRIELLGTDTGDTIGCGWSFGFGCGFGSRLAILLEPGDPDDSLLPKDDGPAIRNVESQTQVEVLPDGSGVLLRNIPAGTWDVSVGALSVEGTAEPGQVVIHPGGHARASIRLR